MSRYQRYDSVLQLTNWKKRRKFKLSTSFDRVSRTPISYMENLIEHELKTSLAFVDRITFVRINNATSQVHVRFRHAILFARIWSNSIRFNPAGVSSGRLFSASGVILSVDHHGRVPMDDTSKPILVILTCSYLVKPKEIFFLRAFCFLICKKESLIHDSR